MSGYYDVVIVAEGMTLDEYLESNLLKRPTRLDVSSVLIDNVFESLSGYSASALAVERSQMILISEREGLVNFSKNIARDGSTILGKKAVIIMRGIIMNENLGSKGGCLYIL